MPFVKYFSFQSNSKKDKEKSKKEDDENDCKPDLRKLTRMRGNNCLHSRKD